MFRLVVEVYKSYYLPTDATGVGTWEALQSKYPCAEEVEVCFHTEVEMNRFLDANLDEAINCRWYDEAAREDTEYFPSIRIITSLEPEISPISFPGDDLYTRRLAAWSEEGF